MPVYSNETTASQVAQSLSSYIKNKTVLVTGVSPGGLGAHFLSSIYPHHPRLLILANRSLPLAHETASSLTSTNPELVNNVEIRFLHLDLGSQESVRKAAAEVVAYKERIDVVVNNAGVMACDYSKTEDGIEKQFGTNHIGHFLFTNLIMEKLRGKGDDGSLGRIVSVSSDGHRFSPIRWDDLEFQDGKTYNKWKAYGQSKTANMLFAVSLAEKLGSEGPLAYSLHPGVIWTNLGRHMDNGDIDNIQALDKELGNEMPNVGLKMISIPQGTARHVYVSFDPSIIGKNGAHFSNWDPKVDDVKPYAIDKGEAEKLWKLSEEIVKQRFEY